MLKPTSTLPLLEEDGNISIESINLENVGKGEIKFDCKKNGGKLSKEKIILNKILSTSDMRLIPAKELIKYFAAIQEIAEKNLTSKDINRYHACLKKLLRACVSNNRTEIIGSAHGLLAHQMTLYNKYNLATKTKKPKKFWCYI